MTHPAFKFFAFLITLPFWDRTAAQADSVPLDTHRLATLAVQDHGRKKPFTTFAYETMLTLSGTSTPDIDEGGGQMLKLPPEEIILDLWLRPEGWDERPIIMVTFASLREKLGLPSDPEKKLFSFRELIGNKALLDLLDEAQKVLAVDSNKLTSLQKEAQHLGERMRLFQDCVNGQVQFIVPNPTTATAHWALMQDIGFGRGIWLPFQDSRSTVGTAAAEGASVAFKNWYDAYRARDISKFNSLTPPLVDALREIAPAYYPRGSELQFEHSYMSLRPFRQAWIIYFCALVVLLLTAVWARKLGYQLGWLLIFAGLGFEIYGFASRIIISGRPPVTDLYETVIWVSFMAMLVAVILEAIYRRRFFFYAGLPASILTLILADSDSTILNAAINPLTPVLRNNMWLTVHVLTIVSSYAAFALSAALGHIALGMTFWRGRYGGAMKEVQLFIYRAMQIGVLLLATGTLLGGVWANYSWGRFWAWDPKETWAAVTLLCYLALFHGRLAGWWGGFGTAVGSVVCFLSVLMSWYGVNFILGQNGRSLHSYGLSTGGLGYAGGFAGFEIVFVAIVIFWNRSQASLTTPRSDRREPALAHAKPDQI